MPNARPREHLAFITEYPNGTCETRELELAELPKILTEVFDIELSEPDAAVLAQGPWLP
ncbi:hypothetical protein ACW2Q0_22005 [Nocardia sp. R16R-3T]